ncbi:MAG: response regulator [Burkholderiales bacterium]|nr:response regulator [Burkholderiales bacterium]
MELDTVFVKTRAGIDEQLDPRSRLSFAFRRLLTAIDGKASLADLQTQFPQLSGRDLRVWASELAQLKFIEPVPPREAAAPATYDYHGYVEMTADPEFKKTAAEVSQWLRANAKAGERTPEEDLQKTASMATLEATTTIGGIERTGFFMHPPSAEAAPAAGPRRVLIVEDDPLQAKLLSTIVAREGLVLEVAKNRADVIAALNRQPAPDLLLLDVELPDVDGFAILEKVRAHPTLKTLRVVMVTGRTDRADIAKGVLLGADGYITKPYRPATMAAAIRQALGMG